MSDVRSLYESGSFFTGSTQKIWAFRRFLGELYNPNNVRMILVYGVGEGVPGAAEVLMGVLAAVIMPVAVDVAGLVAVGVRVTTKV
jgi:hypothetical protein